MSTFERRSRNAINIWPGFVDALATLLLVFIFMLVVFVVAQFHLTDALSKRNTALEKLGVRIERLNAELAQERSVSVELRQSVATLQGELQTLQAQDEDLQQRLDRASTQAAQFALSARRLQAALDDALLQVKTGEEALQLRLEEIARLQELRAKLANDIAQLDRELADSRTDTETERERLAAITEDRDKQKQSLEEALRQAQSLQAALDEAQLTIKADRETIELRLQDMAKLQADIATLIQARDQLQTRVAELVAEAEQRQADITATSERNKALENRLAQTEERSRTVQQEVAARDSLLEELQKRLAANESILGGLSSARDALQQRLTEKTAQVEQAKLDIKQLQAALDEARLQVGANENVIELHLREIAQLKEDLAALRVLRDNLENQVGKLAAELDRNTTQTAAERERGKALAVRLAKAEEGTRLAQQEIEQRDIRLAELNARMADSLADKNKSIDGLTEQLKQVLDQIDGLKAELAETTAEAERRRVALDEALENVDINKATVEMHALEILRLQQDAIALAKVRDQLEQQVGKLAAQLKDSKTTVAAERNRSKALEARLATAEETTQLAQQELSDRESRLEQLTARLASRDKELTEARINADISRDRLERLDSNLGGLYRQINLLSETLMKSDAIIDNKDEEILFLRSQLASQTNDNEVSGYRSEFFEKLSIVLGDRPDIRIVGDRFLFQSELLFDTASATLGDSGKEQLDRVAETLKQISAQIPNEINWVLQVNGHTDKRPISTVKFPSNWELSAARAISIVRYLMSQGIPPNRLAATGFAEYYPIDPADSERAYSRNRRIELKFTSR